MMKRKPFIIFMSESRAPELGINSWLEDELYQQYLNDRKNVDESWKEVFDTNGGNGSQEPAPANGSHAPPGGQGPRPAAGDVPRAARHCPPGRQDPAGPPTRRRRRAEFVVVCAAERGNARPRPTGTCWKSWPRRAGQTRSTPPRTPANWSMTWCGRRCGACRPPEALFSWWPTLVVLLLLLTVEWVARKWSGLP